MEDQKEEETTIDQKVEENKNDAQDPDQSVKIEEKKGPLYFTFHGKLQREISYEKEGEEHLHSTVDEEFLSVFLNPTVSHEFYSAWDKEFRSTLEMDVDGENKTCNQTTWLKQLPETLLFSINRAQMGETSDSASKVNSKFDFKDKIYVDRYMQEYKDESNKCAEKV